MSVNATSWAWSVSGLSSSLKLTLLAIADACNSDGYGFPGQTRIAEQVDCSDRQIRTNVKTLENMDLLAVIHRPGDGSGRHSNAYQLNMDVRPTTTTKPEGKPRPQPPAKEEQPVIQDQGNRKFRVEATGSLGGGQPEVLGGATGSLDFLLTSDRTSDRTKDTYSAISSHGVGEPTGFTEFWQTWPTGCRKRGRKAALASWLSLRLEGQAPMIIADVRTRSTHDQQWLRGYAPMPQTYLRGARWEDELQGPNQQEPISDTLAGIMALERFKCQSPNPGLQNSSPGVSRDSPFSNSPLPQIGGFWK